MSVTKVVKAMILRRARESDTVRKPGGNQALLMVRHDGALEFPGGKVEPGESLEQALRREVYEETGLSIDIGPICDAWEPPSQNNGRQIEGMTYLCILAGGQSGTVKTSSEHLGSLWVSTGDLEYIDPALC